jgi:hypothetical protein
VPELVKGYYTNPEGVTVEQDIYKADLIEACAKWPKQWSKTPPKAKASK